MNAVNVYPLSDSSDIDSDFRTREPEPAPETSTRRAVKAHKAEIKRLQVQIRAEEKRISLAQERYALEERLRTLRTAPTKSPW